MYCICMYEHASPYNTVMYAYVHECILYMLQYMSTYTCIMQASPYSVELDQKLHIAYMTHVYHMPACPDDVNALVQSSMHMHISVSHGIWSCICMHICISFADVYIYDVHASACTYMHMHMYMMYIHIHVHMHI
jgi:hypothetical protein